MNKLDKFDWGLWKEIGQKEYIYNEIFVNRDYEHFVQVEEGDTVVDVGASVGPFAKSILHKKPKKVFCIEPDTRNIPILKSNITAENVTFVEEGIGPRDGYIITDRLIDVESKLAYSNKLNSIKVIKFNSFVRKYSIDKIDYLKVDCEGHEYDIFNQENAEWIYNNVKKVSGEFHLHTPELKSKFDLFKEVYLKKFDNYRVCDVALTDITSELWQDWFTPSYLRIYVFIDNTN